MRRTTILLAASILAGEALAGGEIRVPSDYETIQEAVDAASDGDTVLVEPGTYLIDVPIDINRLHDPAAPESPPLKNIVLRSTGGAEATTIRMHRPRQGTRASIMVFEKGEGPETVVEGFTLTSGHGIAWGENPWQFGGAGIACLHGSSPTIVRSRIINNFTHEEFSRGGGVLCWRSSPTFIECDISRNGSVWAGGGVYTAGTPTEPRFVRCTIDLNVAPRFGGGFLCEPPSRPRIEECTISRNRVEDRGGGIVCGMDTDISDCRIEENEAGSAGGVDATGSVTIRGCVISENRSGGLVLRAGSTVTVSNCSVMGNEGGGVLCLDGAEPTIRDSSILRNHAPSGAGLLMRSGGGSVLRCEIFENRAENSGGGVLVENASPLLERCVVMRNLSGFDGGGIACVDRSRPVLSGCIVAANSAGRPFLPAQSFDWGGGGILVGRNSDSTIRGCTIIGNFARLGGGLSFVAGSRGVVENCLVVGNLARTGGGGVFVFSSSSMSLVNCTVSGNDAPEHGGIFCSFSDPEVINSIIWKNSPDSFCGQDSTSLTTRDPRFVRAGRFQFESFFAVEIAGEEASMPDFVDDPGDYRLLPTSPAIDSGHAARAPETDLDGNPRPCGAGVDLGAYELCEDREPRFRRGSIDADGVASLADAVSILNYLFLGGPAPECLASADVDDSGGLTLTDPVALLEHLFLGGVAPPEPFFECGVDPTPDDLSCAGGSGCPEG